ncbi:MAG: hypothetical protein ACTSPB_07040 [Candidatus Thorarchaeota archaeon]
MAKKKRKKYLKDGRLLSSVLLLLVASNIAVSFATLGVYEFGHIIAGKMVGCSMGRAIIYAETFTTYSEMWCPEGLIFKIIVLFGGILAIFFFGILFYLIPGFPPRYLSFVIWGLGLYFNYENLNILGIHPYIQWFVAFVGIVLILYGEDRFVTEQIKS